MSCFIGTDNTIYKKNFRHYQCSRALCLSLWSTTFFSRSLVNMVHNKSLSPLTFYYFTKSKLSKQSYPSQRLLCNLVRDFLINFECPAFIQSSARKPAVPHLRSHMYMYPFPQTVLYAGIVWFFILPLFVIADKEKKQQKGMRGRTKRSTYRCSWNSSRWKRVKSSFL